MNTGNWHPPHLKKSVKSLLTNSLSCDTIRMSRAKESNRYQVDKGGTEILKSNLLTNPLKYDTIRVQKARVRQPRERQTHESQ